MLSPSFFCPVAIVIKSILICSESIFILFLSVVIVHLRFSVSPTHSKGNLLIDQQNQAAAPAATHPMTFMRSPSMILRKRAQRLTIPQSPAQRVRKRLPKKPMTFRKVLDTIDSISENLCIVKLNDVYSFVSARHRRKVLVHRELQSSLLICRNRWPGYSQHLCRIGSSVPFVRSASVLHRILHKPNLIVISLLRPCPLWQTDRISSPSGVCSHDSR